MLVARTSAGGNIYRAVCCTPISRAAVSHGMMMLKAGVLRKLIG